MVLAAFELTKSKHFFQKEQLCLSVWSRRHWERGPPLQCPVRSMNEEHPSLTWTIHHIDTLPILVSWHLWLAHLASIEGIVIMERMIGQQMRVLLITITGN
jgi:hypothetical protein